MGDPTSADASRELNLQVRCIIYIYIYIYISISISIYRCKYVLIYVYICINIYALDDPTSADALRELNLQVWCITNIYLYR